MSKSAMDPKGLLSRVCVLIAHADEAGEAIQAITDLLADHLGSWVFEVWLCRNADSLDLMARSIAGSVSAEGREKLTASPSRALVSDDLLVSRVVRSEARRTWNVDDPDVDSTSREILGTLGAKEITALPIRDNGNVVGVATVTPPPERSVTEDDEEILGVVLGNMALLLHRIHRLDVDRAQTERITRLETAIRSLPLGVKVLSPDWIIEYVNPAVGEMLGYSPDELLGKPISLVREAEGAGSPQAEVAALVRLGTWTGDLMDRHKDGHGVPVRLVVAPVRDADGEVTGIVEIARSLSREMEQEKRAKNAYRLAVVGQLAASVAHEVNNPLSAITMLTRVLLDDPLPDKLREDLEIINSEAHRAGGISRNLLVFARQEDVQKSAVDLEEVVRETVHLKLPDLRLSDIEIDVVVSGEVRPALANAGHMRQILHNLISNAAHSIQDDKDRGRIRVTLSSLDSGWVELTVEDNGPGIPEEVLAKVMKPFFTTKAVGKGTGLGLSVCRDIVEDHGGEISIENLAGDEGASTGYGGVRVTVRLPAAETEGRARGERTMARAAKVEPTRLLIIDDDIGVASSLKRLVERMGYTAEVEHRGETALSRIAEGGHFDAIITDLNMPGIGGEGVYREVERLRPDLLERLVVMSGEIAPEADHEFLRRASGRTLQKPFTPDQLRAALDAVLEEARD